MQRLKSSIIAFGLALVSLGGWYGCNFLLDFDSCESNDDCHQYEDEFGLQCDEGQCVVVNCHHPDDCPEGDEYECQNQRCVHGGHDEHADEDAGNEDAGTEETGGGHGH